jgi:hypothetical protein
MRQEWEDCRDLLNFIFRKIGDGGYAKEEAHGSRDPCGVKHRCDFQGVTGLPSSMFKHRLQLLTSLSKWILSAFLFS